MFNAACFISALIIFSLSVNWINYLLNKTFDLLAIK